MIKTRADGYHDAKAAPGQPGAEQGDLGPSHDRPGAVVPLEPHARLDHPRPMHPAVACSPALLYLGHRPATGALRAGVAERHQLVVGHVGAHLAPGALHPLSILSR